MPQIFISYRRRDSIDITARLCDHLKLRFGASSIFLDYKRMSGGDDFLEVIDQGIDSCDALISVIGPNWKGEHQLDKPNRIHDSADVVRRELERAFAKQVPILPVFVGGASYLSANELPESLKKLATKHALELRSGLDFEGDLRRIIECLERITNSWTNRNPSPYPFSTPLTSAMSRTRLPVLAMIRFGAVMGAIGSSFYGIHWLVNTKEIQLPTLSTVGVATLAIGLIGISFSAASWARTRLVAQFARRWQATAISELATLILRRLETPTLLSVGSVRGLASGLALKHRCPVITDSLITEAIRSAAISLEYDLAGVELSCRLRLLNDLLLSIDEFATPLCSIAVVDRLSAYIQSQPILASAVIFALLLSMTLPVFTGTNWSSWTLAFVASSTSIAFLIWASTERAIRYWRDDLEVEVSATGTRISPSSPRLLIDFFLTASVTHSRWTEVFWHQVWAPLFENVIFLRRSERQIAAMHEFRFDVAEILWKELKKVDIDLEQSVHLDRVERGILEQRFIELARRLWVVTGEPQFRIIEARGTIVREDRESGIVGLL